MSGSKVCPECKHPWENHDREEGCLEGWSWAADATLLTEGCACHLAHTRRSR